jgi:hypothetical protein
MIAAASKAEADDCDERFADERGGDGKRLVVRNGRARGAARDGRVGHRGGAGAARR